MKKDNKKEAAKKPKGLKNQPSLRGEFWTHNKKTGVSMCWTPSKACPHAWLARAG